MKRYFVLFVVFVLAAVAGCAKDQGGGESRADAPPTEAPKETLGIQAPADGSAKDARRIESDEGDSNAAGGKDVAKEGITEDDLGLPFYPNSKRASPGHLRETSKGLVAEISLSTEDGVDKVAEFYKSRLDSIVHEVRGGNMVALNGEKDGRRYTIAVTKNGTGALVGIVGVKPKN